MDLGEKLEAIAAKADAETASALRELRKEIDAQVTAIFMEGGQIQKVFTDRFISGTVLVYDYETEGAHEESLISVPQDTLSDMAPKERVAYGAIFDVERVPHDHPGAFKLSEIADRIRRAGEAYEQSRPRPGA